MHVSHIAISLWADCYIYLMPVYSSSILINAHDAVFKLIHIGNEIRWFQGTWQRNSCEGNSYMYIIPAGTCG